MKRHLFGALVALALSSSCYQSSRSGEQRTSLLNQENTSACSRKELPYLPYNGFVRPGGLVGQLEIRRLWEMASWDDPKWNNWIQILRTNTPIDYEPQAYRHIHIDYASSYKNEDDRRQAKIQHEAFVEKDGVQAYQQAIMFQLTCDSRYAENTIKILDAWATTNETFNGQNAPLVAAWGTASMARAAELLKYTYRWWRPELEKRYIDYVNRVLEPQMNRMIRWDYSNWHNNWHTTITEAKMQIAILRNDRPAFDEMLQYFKRILDGREGFDQVSGRSEFDRYVWDSGQTGETCRDMVHAQFGIGSLLQIPEIAWQQGVDLYNYRDSVLAKVMEFHAKIIVTHQLPPGIKNVSPRLVGQDCILSQIGFQPVWEIGLNHYAGRKKMEMTASKRLMDNHRPEKMTFHWGLTAV